MKTYTEEDLREAYRQGAIDYCNSHKGLSNFINTEVDIYIESLSPKIEEEKEIPITYGLIKASCGWGKFAEVTNRNVHAIKEFGDYAINEVFYITESKAKQLKFII